jgi:hypothetical protein
MSAVKLPCGWEPVTAPFFAWVTLNPCPHTDLQVEWVVAMNLVWQYAEATGNPRWKGLTWGMLPSLGSAMCACTWHFFYNSPSLEFLVGLQVGGGPHTTIEATVWGFMARDCLG